jgi:hypothetical protein
MSEFTLPQPRPDDDREKLADWLEVEALLSSDGIGKLRELARTLEIGGRVEVDESTLVEQESIEPEELIDQLDSVIPTLAQRADTCVTAYPFIIDQEGTHVRAHESWASSTYTWMLLSCHFPANGRFSRGKSAIYHARLFETLCVEAAKRYLGGDAQGACSFHFASPRPDRSGFATALGRLQAAMHAEPRNLETRDEKDSDLDVMAWRPWNDRVSNYLALFGQCAGGNNWDQKFPNPCKFTDNWIELHGPDPIAALFLPRMLDAHEFRTNRSQGVIFNRCRIAALVPNLDELGAATAGNPFKRWMTQAIVESGAVAPRH